MGLSLLFPGSGYKQKESDAFAPFPANLIRRSGRSPALPYPPYEQSNYYYAQVCFYYSFVSLDSFSFVHWWGCGTPTKFSWLKLDILTKSPVNNFSFMRDRSQAIFCYTGLLPKRCRRDLNPLNNKIFEIKIVQIAHIINIQAWAPVSCFLI